MIDTVRNLAKKIVYNAKCVTILPYGIETISDELLKSELKEWQTSAKENALDVKDRIIFELMANSVNYCYWYGWGDIRPNGANSSQMYNWLSESFDMEASQGIDEEAYKNTIDRFEYFLRRDRFPMLAERSKHLSELRKEFIHASSFVKQVMSDSFNLDNCLDNLTFYFPGYGEDLFLKRAQLLFMQLNRFTGLFENEISQLTVPADYQVPRVLRESDCLNYRPDLRKMVDNNIMIPKGSRYEVEIRASAIVACDMIAEKAKVSPMVVDNYLWQNRKVCKLPFHLTLTTDY